MMDDKKSKALTIILVVIIVVIVGVLSYLGYIALKDKKVEDTYTQAANEFEKIYGIKASLLLERYNKGYRDDKLVYKGSLRHFQKTDLKRDSKGRYLKKEEQFQSKEKL